MWVGAIAVAAIALPRTFPARTSCAHPSLPISMSASQEPTTSEAEQARAAALRVKGQAEVDVGGHASANLDLFAQVDIASGTFKYVLINAATSDGRERKTLLRSGPGDYHVDVATPTVDALKAAGLIVEIPGGGRINRDDAAREISIFGFSYSFGKGDHALAAEMCRSAFPGFKISWSDEGY